MSIPQFFDTSMICGTMQTNRSDLLHYAVRNTISKPYELWLINRSRRLTNERIVLDHKAVQLLIATINAYEPIAQTTVMITSGEHGRLSMFCDAEGITLSQKCTLVVLELEFLEQFKHMLTAASQKMLTAAISDTMDNVY